MNSRNAFLLAGAAILILIAAVVLLLAGGGDDDDGGSGGGVPEDRLSNVDADTAFAALYDGDAGPIKTIACDEAAARLDEVAVELAAIPRPEGAEIVIGCDVGATAGDCAFTTTVGDEVTEVFVEFAITEDMICTPIQLVP